jgi:protein-tyrosine phosphatase
VIDLHTHILPGLDDGSRTMEDAIAMARAALEDGLRAVAATPHVRDDYPTTVDDMERGVAALREALLQAGVPLQILTGGEVAHDRLPGLSDDEVTRFGLGGNPDYLLVEFPYHGWPLALPQQVRELLARGVIPVLAHPERNADVQRDPELLRPLVLMGTLCQVTAASLDGRIGKRSRATGLALIETGLAHLVASDAHAPEIRGIGMTAAAAAVGDEALAGWLTQDVPAAIVAATPIPPRPASRARRRFPKFGR